MRGRRRRKLSTRGRVTVILLIAAGAALLIDLRLRPLIKAVIANQAQVVSEEAINEAVAEELSRTDVDYSDLTCVEKNTEGKVLAIQTNPVRMNQFKSSVGKRIQQKLRRFAERGVEIPLGTLLGSELLRDRGPQIPLKITLAGSVASRFKSNLSSAGINQSRHQIFLDVQIEIYVVIPGYNVPLQIDTNVVIAETVIVGEVPEVFASQGEESASGFADLAQLREDLQNAF